MLLVGIFLKFFTCTTAYEIDRSLWVDMYQNCSMPVSKVIAESHEFLAANGISSVFAEQIHGTLDMLLCVRNFRIIQTSDDLFIAVFWKVPWDWPRKTRCLLLVVATLNSRHLTWGWLGCIRQMRLYVCFKNHASVWNWPCDWDQNCFELGIKNLDIYTYMNKSALDMIYNFDLNLDKGYIDYILLRIFWVTSIRTRWNMNFELASARQSRALDLDAAKN